MLKKIANRLRAALLTPGSRQELQEVLVAAWKKGLIDQEIRQMMERTMMVDEKYVGDAMVPRTQMKTVHKNGSPQEWLRTIKQTGHSRYPVTGENLDDIQGLLLAKDFLVSMESGEPLKEIIRPAYRVPESMRVDDLLSNLRQRRTHIAIVMDEHGGTAGLVTLEDALEEIIGEIEDEHDELPISPFSKTGDNRYTMEATTPIKEFNEHFGISLREGDVKTIGGLFARRMGRVPRRGDELRINGFRFQVLRADPRKPEILQVAVPEASRKKEEETGNGNQGDMSQ